MGGSCSQTAHAKQSKALFDNLGVVDEDRHRATLRVVLPTDDYYFKTASALVSETEDGIPCSNSQLTLSVFSSNGAPTELAPSICKASPLCSPSTCISPCQCNASKASLLFSPSTCNSPCQCNSSKASLLCSPSTCIPHCITCKASSLFSPSSHPLLVEPSPPQSPPDSPALYTVAKSHVKSREQFLADLMFKIKIGKPIGKGTQGQVFSALTRSGQFIAVKKLALNGLAVDEARKALQDLKNEVRHWAALDHVNVVKYYGIDRQGDELYIQMELVQGGSVAATIKEYGSLDESVARKYIKQLVNALEYIHGKGLIHRDIKSANLLVTELGIVKVADFGCAKKIGGDDHWMTLTVKGTPGFMAPEIIREEGHNSAADIWSAGATALEMLSGGPPWADMFPLAVMNGIASNSLEVPYPESISDSARAFIGKCMHCDFAARPTATELHQFDWMEGIELNEVASHRTSLAEQTCSGPDFIVQSGLCSPHSDGSDAELFAHTKFVFRYRKT